MLTVTYWCTIVVITKNINIAHTKHNTHTHNIYCNHKYMKITILYIYILPYDNNNNYIILSLVSLSKIIKQYTYRYFEVVLNQNIKFIMK